MNIDAKTTICCIIGDPVSHSLSPVMHNAGYQELGLNFAYVAFGVKDVKKALDGIVSLGIRGVSVTVPHKRSVIPFLHKIDETARQIGAINTIVNNNGILTGYNTDYTGALLALEEKTDLANKRVLLLGAGGAARALAFGLKQKNVSLTISNRTKDHAKKLAEEVGTTYNDSATLTDLSNIDILINATTVGMKQDAKPLIEKHLLHKNLVVFDIVYTPKVTQLIQDAKSIGCEVVYGYKMLLYQAVLQFELFTGQKAPVSIMEQVLIQELEGEI